jgi:vitamin B12 transporter
LRQLFSEGPTFRGNPDLLPERSRMWDAGVHFQALSGAAIGEVGYYSGWANDGIFSVFNAAAGFSRPQNIDSRVTMRGVETSLSARLLEPLSMQLAYTWSESIIESSGQQLFERPNHVVSAALALTPMSWLETGLNVTYRGEQYASFPSDFLMDDVFLLGATASWEVNERVAVFGRIENLTDEEYEERLGTGTARRSAYLGARARLW